jgi:hypothetical protein
LRLHLLVDELVLVGVTHHYQAAATVAREEQTDLGQCALRVDGAGLRFKYWQKHGASPDDGSQGAAVTFAAPLLVMRMTLSSVGIAFHPTSMGQSDQFHNVRRRPGLKGSASRLARQ